MSRLKAIGSLLLCVLLLSACGGYKAGQQYKVVNESIISFATIDDYKTEMEDTDKVIEVDGETLLTLITDTKIKIKDFNKENKLILVEVIDGYYEGEEVWIPLYNFKEQTERLNE